MAIIAICTPIFILFIIFDLIPLLRKKQWKEFWIYSVLISVALVIHILIALDYKLPSPAGLTKRFAQYIFGIQSE